MAQSRAQEALMNEARKTEEALRASLHRLSSRLTGARPAPDDLLGLATGPLGQTVLAAAAGRALRGAPWATVLLGAGLAWLTFAPRHNDSLSERLSDTIDDWQARADAARDAARNRLSSLYNDLSDRGTEAAEFAQEKASITADLAADLASAFSHGLSDLGDEAAEQIIAARERAYAAIATGAGAVHDHFDGLAHPADSRNFVSRHPVASAAVAVALGAALATALQVNRREGETLGQSAEALLAKARKTFGAEASAAGRAMGEAAAALRARGTEVALALVGELTTLLESSRATAHSAAKDAATQAEETQRKSARRAAAAATGTAKRAAAQSRNRRRATQKMAEKLTGNRPN